MCVCVDQSLDLLETVAEITLDNKALLEDLMAKQLTGPVSDADATLWLAQDQQVWAVVVAPYVFMQKVKDDATKH